MGFRIEAKVRKYVLNKWRKYYKVIFYSVTIIFAYIHLFNFEISSSILLLSPLLVLPQFIAGIHFGYIRVKCGFLWGCFMHGLYNSILIGFTLISMSRSEQKPDTKNDACLSPTVKENALVPAVVDSLE